MKQYVSEVSVAQVYINPLINPMAPGPTGEKPPISGETLLTGIKAVTVLMGRNGSGKSRLLRAWYNQSKDSRQIHLIQPERSGDFGQDSAIAKQLILSPSVVGVQPAMMGQVTGNRGDQFRRLAMTRVLAVARKRLGDRIVEPNTELERLAGYLEQVLVTFRFTFDTFGEDPTIEARDPALPGGYVRSSGEDEVISLLVDLWTIGAIWHMNAAESRVVLIDEPDLHLHPDLQIHLARALVQIAQQFDLQLVVATHSVTLASALGDCTPGDSSIAFLTGSRTDHIRAHPFDKHYSGLVGVLGGQAMLFPLVGAPLLLVEGSDDQLIWSQLARNRQMPWAIIPCSGADETKKAQQILEMVFSSMRQSGSTPVGYALLDGDQSLPGPRERPQEHIRFIQLACRESENLFLSDEILEHLGLTWPEANQKLIQAVGSHPDIREALQDSMSWDRKCVDLKQIIKRVAHILDAKDRPWFVAIGQCLRDDRPSGQLAEFLGEDVLNVFWPTPDSGS